MSWESGRRGKQHRKPRPQKSDINNMKLISSFLLYIFLTFLSYHLHVTIAFITSSVQLSCLYVTYSQSIFISLKCHMHNECAHTHTSVCVCAWKLYTGSEPMFSYPISVTFYSLPFKKKLLFLILMLSFANWTSYWLYWLLLVFYANFNNRIHFIFMSVSLIRNSKWNAFSLLFLLLLQLNVSFYVLCFFFFPVENDSNFKGIFI